MLRTRKFLPSSRGGGRISPQSDLLFDQIFISTPADGGINLGGISIAGRSNVKGKLVVVVVNNQIFIRTQRHSIRRAGICLLNTWIYL